jgi:hypothetical protein
MVASPMAHSGCLGEGAIDVALGPRTYKSPRSIQIHRFHWQIHRLIRRIRSAS